MEYKKVYTEEPELELWRSLLRYSYKANIKRYFLEHNIAFSEDGKGNGEDIDILSNSIAGALQQADEYYRASKVVSLQVEPLLLYYGTTNLLYAMSVLLAGKVPQISHHGMKIIANPQHSHIADTSVKFIHPADGGVHIFASMLGHNLSLCNCKDWKLEDCLDSIAEIRDDFNQCYSSKHSHVLPLSVFTTPEGLLEKIYIDQQSAEEVIRNVEGLSSAYLVPQKVKGRDNEACFVLRHKINGTKISRISYSGQPYLLEAHKKPTKLITLPTELNLYISLFALCSLCRYNPEIWNPFVIQDTTGEKLLVEKLLYYSRRILPNIILNRIMDGQIIFVSDKYVPEDRTHLVSAHEVREIVVDEIHKQLHKELANSIIKNRS